MHSDTRDQEAAERLTATRDGQINAAWSAAAKMLADSHYITIFTCTRCGQDHEEILCNPLTNPPEEFTHYAICPRTHEPILITIELVGIAPAAEQNAA